MVSPLNLLEEQMRISRSEEGINILERCFGRISNPSEISERVRNFYLQFALKAEQSKNAEMAWTELLGSGCAEYVSCYRIDSYLLADAPFTLRSPIFFLSTSTTTLKNGTYYRVKADGLKLLIENFLAWPVADDIQNYPDVIKKKLIKRLNKNPPLYAHCFEVSLATYWLKNIKSSLDANSRQIAKDFEEGKATYLDFLLNVYYPYKTKQGNLKKVIENIPPGPSGGAPPLNYSDLRGTTKERLMRVSLFSEVLSGLTNQKIEWVQLDKVLEDLEGILKNQQKNQQLNNAQRKKKVSEYVYKFWQIYGTPWSYSRGGTTDFSLRDLSPSELKEAQPQKTEESFKIHTFSKFKQIVERTNIDDANNRGKQAKERKELLEGLVKAAKKEIGQYGAPWMLISYIGPLARAYERQNQQKINDIKEKITELLKEASGKAIEEFISGVAIHLTIKPIIHSFSHLISEVGDSTLGIAAPTLETLSSIVLVGEIGHLLKKLESYQITELGVHYSHIFSDQVQLQYISKSPRFRMAIVNLPYQREGCQFSGRSLDAIGYRNLP
jgi:hypothetical protein